MSLGGFDQDARRFEDIDRAQRVAICETCPFDWHGGPLHLTSDEALDHQRRGHDVRPITAKERT